MAALQNRGAGPGDAGDVEDAPTNTTWAAKVPEHVATLSSVVRKNLPEVTRALNNCVSALEDAEKQLRTAIETKQANMKAEEETMRKRIEKDRQTKQANMKGEEEAMRKRIEKDRQLLSDEVERLEVEKETMKGVHAFQSGRMKLDVGGHRFTTSLTTLTSQPGSMLAAMFSGRHKLAKDEEGAYFIDRDGTNFRFILNFLRDGQLGEGTLPEGRFELLEILRESEYYQLTALTDHIRATFMPVVTQSQMDSLKYAVSKKERGGYPRASSFQIDGSDARSRTSHTMSQCYDMEGKNLANLSFAKLHFNQECSFQGSYLRGADFSGCHFEAPVYFNDANLKDANFEQCGGLLSVEVDFTGAKLDGAKFLPGVKEQLKT